MGTREGRELDCFLAEKIMGLETYTAGNSTLVYEEGKGARRFEPSTDLLAALELVDAIGKMSLECRRRFMRALNEQSKDPCKQMIAPGTWPAPFWWFMFIADKSVAICRAAEQVAEMMEAEHD